MKSVLMDPAESRQPSNVFSPAGQYLTVHSQLSIGAHHMVLKATENELYEHEVACFIDGTKVGTLHENETYDYHQSIRNLNAHGMELLVPCRVTESKMIYYRPVPRESLQKWVREQIPEKLSEVALRDPEVLPEAATEETTEDAHVIVVDAKKVSSRISRHILKLLSQDWFSPLDMPIIERLIYGLYWHEKNTVDGTLGVQQSNALVLVTYALYRASSESVLYDQTVRISETDKAVIVVKDLDMVEAIIKAPYKGELMASAIISGSGFSSV